MDSSRGRRKPNRLAGFDYASARWYFVTICTAGKKHVLGSVADNGLVRLSVAGRIVAQCIEELPEFFPGLQVDRWVVMPNHLHLLLYLAPTSLGAHSRTLSDVIGRLKSVSARRILASEYWPGGPVWQRSFHDHIVRPNEDLAALRHYIASNPTRWATRGP